MHCCCNVPDFCFSAASRPSLDLQLPPRRHTPKKQETEKKLHKIMEQSGKIKINGIEYLTDIADLEDLGELGSGTSGQVVKMRHTPSGEIIAVKQMRRTGNDDENKRITTDLDVVLKAHGCPYIVQCLGYIITTADVYICMELMATCFDKLLKRRYHKLIPEEILGKVTVAVRFDCFLRLLGLLDDCNLYSFRRLRRWRI